MGKRVLGKDALDKERHYVVIGSTRYYDEIRGELKGLGFKAHQDFAAYALIAPVWRRGLSGRRVNGVFVGRLSYFPDSWKDNMAGPEHGGVESGYNLVASIGRFTSIRACCH